jgi:hypothetical protein
MIFSGGHPTNTRCEQIVPTGIGWPLPWMIHPLPWRIYRILIGAGSADLYGFSFFYLWVGLDIMSGTRLGLVMVMLW